MNKCQWNAKCLNRHVWCSIARRPRSIPSTWRTSKTWPAPASCAPASRHWQPWVAAIWSFSRRLLGRGKKRSANKKSIGDSEDWTKVLLPVKFPPEHIYIYRSNTIESDWQISILYLDPSLYLIFLILRTCGRSLAPLFASGDGACFSLGSGWFRAGGWRRAVTEDTENTQDTQDTNEVAHCLEDSRHTLDFKGRIRGG